MITIVVHGQPAPQGSKRAVVHKSSGRAVVMESSKRVKPWRDAVRSEAVTAMADAGLERFDGPLFLEVTFYFDRPKGHHRTGRNAHLLRDDAPTAPTGMPDLSKLIRSTEDALTDAGVWVDDARVTLITASKLYAGPGARTDSPGAVIRVRRL